MIFYLIQEIFNPSGNKTTLYLLLLYAIAPFFLPTIQILDKSLNLKMSQSTKWSDTFFVTRFLNARVFQVSFQIQIQMVFLRLVWSGHHLPTYLKGGGEILLL